MPARRDMASLHIPIALITFMPHVVEGDYNNPCYEIPAPYPPDLSHQLVKHRV